MTAPPASGVIEADGAGLYYQRRGDGPALLMISGGGGDAARYSRVAGILAQKYTVLTYDRRGNAKSRRSGDSDGMLRMDQQSADARAIIEGNGFGSASVFGNSGGAIIGLDLAARFPDTVDSLVAHEPPAITVLPEADTYAASYGEIMQIMRRAGWQPAAWRFLSMNGLAPRTPVLRGALRLALALNLGPAADMAFFMTHELQEFLSYQIDLDRIAGGRVPVTLGGGHDSRHQPFGRTGEIIAQRLGRPFAEFPGGHTGFAQHPRPFAETLREILASQSATPGQAGVAG